MTRTGGPDMPPPNDAAPTIPGAPRTAIVIVTYNSADVLAECLHSLADGAMGVRLTDVIVADNASRDDSIVIAKEAADLPVRVVEVGRNAGYAAAINAGTDALNLDELDAVFVMNPDCRLRPGVLAVLAGCLAERGRGIAVPRLTNPDGTLQPSLRRAPSVFRALAEAVIGGRLAGRIGTLGELITDPREYETPRAAVWATGAAMLVSVAAIGRIGPWDRRGARASAPSGEAPRPGCAGHRGDLAFRLAARPERVFSRGSRAHLSLRLPGDSGARRSRRHRQRRHG